MKTLALISKDFKCVIDQVRSGEVSLFIKFVKGELKIDGKVYPPGIYPIPMDVELIDEMVRHYEIRERDGRRQSRGRHPHNWAEGKPGINQEANIKELMDEGFSRSVAMRIDKIV
jgi:hypothetical protein